MAIMSKRSCALDERRTAHASMHGRETDGTDILMQMLYWQPRLRTSFEVHVGHFLASPWNGRFPSKPVARESWAKSVGLMLGIL